MQLSMTVLRCPDQVAPEATHRAGGENSTSDAGPGVDWVLPDPDRAIVQSGISPWRFAAARGRSRMPAQTEHI